MKNFIVDLWASIFAILRRFSILYWVRQFFRSRYPSFPFIEVWVLGNMLFAAFCVTISGTGSTSLTQTLLVSYGAIRVFETIVDQINVLLFDEFRARKSGLPYALVGFRRIVILLLHSYLEMLLWFAMFYLTFDRSFAAGSTSLPRHAQAIAYSFYTLTTFGYAETVPVNPLGYFLVYSESIIGLFMALVILSRFLSLLPSPQSLDQWEKR
jgi:hypothetical protein